MLRVGFNETTMALVLDQSAALLNPVLFAPFPGATHALIHAGDFVAAARVVLDEAGFDPALASLVAEVEADDVDSLMLVVERD